MPASGVLDVAAGNQITTRAGRAIVTEVQPAGQETIIFADYGSGIPQPHVAEGIDGVSSPPEQDYPPFAMGSRVQVASSWLEDDIGRQGTVKQPPTAWELAGYEKVLLDGDAICRYFQRGALVAVPCSGGNGGQLSLVEAVPSELVAPARQASSRRHVPKGQACGWIEERLGNKRRKNSSVSYYYCWDDGEGRHRKSIPVRKRSMVQQMWGERRPVAGILAVLM
ncbi:MAG: hypothetical protein AAF289_00070 [Cyanobacteria bacterium P01_A01_bin.135]